MLMYFCSIFRFEHHRCLFDIQMFINWFQELLEHLQFSICLNWKVYFVSLQLYWSMEITYSMSDPNRYFDNIVFVYIISDLYHNHVLRFYPNNNYFVFCYNYNIAVSKPGAGWKGQSDICALVRDFSHSDPLRF